MRLTLHGWWVELHDLDLRVPELLTKHRDEDMHCRFAGAVVEAAWHRNYGERGGGTGTQGRQRQALLGTLAQRLAVCTH